MHRDFRTLVDTAMNFRISQKAGIYWTSKQLPASDGLAAWCLYQITLVRQDTRHAYGQQVATFHHLCFR
jgi:hypothetical protein